jgi:cell division protein FtsA
VAEDVAVWQAGVELVLEEFGKNGQLPARLELCGGGSRLPELQEALRDPRLARDLPFVRPPQVSIMAPEQVKGISDATGLLVDQQDVTPMALAYQAIEMSQKEPPLDAALRRVLRVMRV